jgi:hypothetical protein
MAVLQVLDTISGVPANPRLSWKLVTVAQVRCLLSG